MTDPCPPTPLRRSALASALALSLFLLAPASTVSAAEPIHGEGGESDPPARHAFYGAYAAGGAIDASPTAANLQVGGATNGGCLNADSDSGLPTDLCPMIGATPCDLGSLVGASAFTGNLASISIGGDAGPAQAPTVGGSCGDAANQRLVRTGDTVTIDAVDDTAGRVTYGACVDGNGDGLCRPERFQASTDTWTMRRCTEQGPLEFSHSGQTGFLYLFIFDDAGCVPTTGRVWGVVDTTTSPIAECADGRDNDADGTVDGTDKGCASQSDRDERGEAPEAPIASSSCLAFSTTPTSSFAEHVVVGTCADLGLDPPECLDSKDNDGRERADWPNDPDCDSPLDDRERAPSCRDFEDNDGDDYGGGSDHTDYPNDPGCDSPDDDDESNAWACSDGVDNDGDGRADAPDDPGCSGPYDDDQDEFNVWACSDGVDNDGDGRTDHPSDPGCSGPYDGDEFNPWACSDGIDNDGDRRTDHPNDPGCSGPFDADESNVWPCSDGSDNDGDTRSDMADPGCTAWYDDSESNPWACSDGVDNDGDGRRDVGGDPGCTTWHDSSEYNPWACSDGVDNDGDGLRDYGRDPGCSGPYDDDEWNPRPPGN